MFSRVEFFIKLMGAMSIDQQRNWIGVNEFWRQLWTWSPFLIEHRLAAGPSLPAVRWQLLPGAATSALITQPRISAALRREIGRANRPNRPTGAD